MGLGTTPRPHHITWDYRAGYRASHRHAADTTHFLLSVSHQARKRDRIAHPEPIRTRQSGHPACRPGRDRVVRRPASVPPFPFVPSCHFRTASGVISAVDPDVAIDSGDHRAPDQLRSPLPPWRGVSRLRPLVLLRSRRIPVADDPWPPPRSGSRIRRGCPSHVTPAAWLRHPRRMIWYGRCQSDGSSLSRPRYALPGTYAERDARFRTRDTRSRTRDTRSRTGYASAGR